MVAIEHRATNGNNISDFSPHITTIKGFDIKDKQDRTQPHLHPESQVDTIEHHVPTNDKISATIVNSIEENGNHLYNSPSHPTHTLCLCVCSFA